MATESHLQDSGGHYYDADTPGVVGVVRRNVSSAIAEVTSGKAGGAAIGVAIGFAAAGFVDRLR